MKPKHVVAGLALSALVTCLIACAGPILCLVYAVEGVVKGVKECAVAWWAFARLPWMDA